MLETYIHDFVETKDLKESLAHSKPLTKRSLVINLCAGTEAREAIKAAPAALEEPVTGTLCKISQMRCSEAKFRGSAKVSRGKEHSKQKE